MKKSILVVGVLLMFFSSFNANAQLERYQATFIMNFTRLVQWPNLQNNNSFVIGVLGRNPALVSELRASAAGRVVGALNIEVKEFATIEQMEFSHILFVSNTRVRDLPRVNQDFHNQPVLVVTEFQGRQPEGSIINLSVEDEKLGLHLNQDLALAKGFVLSRQLVSFSR